MSNLRKIKHLGARALQPPTPNLQAIKAVVYKILSVDITGAVPWCLHRLLPPASLFVETVYPEPAAADCSGDTEGADAAGRSDVSSGGSATAAARGPGCVGAGGKGAHGDRTPLIKAACEYMVKTAMMAMVKHPEG